MSKKGLSKGGFAERVKTKFSFLLFALLAVLAVSPLVHSASPYAGNQGSTTRPTTVPNPPPVTPVSQGIKPAPLQNPIKGKVGTGL